MLGSAKSVNGIASKAWRVSTKTDIENQGRLVET